MEEQWCGSGRFFESAAGFEDDAFKLWQSPQNVGQAGRSPSTHLRRVVVARSATVPLETRQRPSRSRPSTSTEYRLR